MPHPTGGHERPLTPDLTPPRAGEGPRPHRTAARHGGSGAGRHDAELVADVRRGASGAFAELYRRYAPAVRVVLRDHVDCADRRDELVQETFARALAGIGSLRDADRFRAWLFQIARNAGIDELVARRRVRLVEFDASLHEGIDTAVGDHAELVADSHGLAEAIRDGLDRLSPRDAAALCLAADGTTSPTEIASTLGVTPGNARVIVHRARRRLRQDLGQRPEGHDTTALSA